MNQSRKQMNAVLLSVFAVLIVVIILIALFFSSKSKEAPTITIPPPAENTLATVPQKPVEENDFLQITTDNVLHVVECLARPEAYHQIYSITLIGGEEQYTTHVELWVNGKLLRAVISTPYATKYVLTDHQTAYVWYSDAEVPRQIILATNITPDDLIGLPTYESLLSIPAEYITDAEYLVLDHPSSRCIYVCVRTGEDTTGRYWIDLDSGLVAVADVLETSQQVYIARQESLDILAAEDEAFETCFQLPNGQAPFKDQTGMPQP